MIVTAASLFECVVNLGAFAKIVLLMDNLDIDVVHRQAAINFMAMMTGHEYKIDLAEEEIMEMFTKILGALMDSGAITKDEKNIILKLGSYKEEVF